MSSFPPKQKHLPTNRRRGSPQHSGHTPRLGFASAILTPPARNGCKNSGARPLASWFTIAVMACRKVKDSAFKHCCRRKGRYPNKPAAEPAANEARAVLTSSEENDGALKRRHGSLFHAL